MDYIWTMKLYERLAMRTSGTGREPIRGEHGIDPNVNYALLNAVLGIAGEGGEISDDLKKTLFHGKPFDREHAIKELGDVLWYVAQASFALDVPLEEVARRNIAKLRERYPEGFSKEASAARRDEA
jgi:NTP pyrophosphatase (non-canonical NTP hydrolase)